MKIFVALLVVALVAVCQVNCRAFPEEDDSASPMGIQTRAGGKKVTFSNVNSYHGGYGTSYGSAGSNPGHFVQGGGGNLKKPIKGMRTPWYQKPLYGGK